MEATAMQALWTRLENWLVANAPLTLATLRPGATEEQIQATEALLEVQFPEDFKASYRLHDGQDYDEDGLIGGREFLSLKRIRIEWKGWKELLERNNFDGAKSQPVGPIRTDWWNPQWIPITNNGAGDHDCLDLNPAEGGSVGQVISFWHDYARREVEAESFGAWFAAFVERCEQGKYFYSEEEGGLTDAYDF